jgi:hypothetical protein
MITIIVLSLLFLALASATGFALISLTDSTTKLFGAQSDVDQMNRWHSVIANSLRPYGENQNLVSPLPVILPGQHYTTLPKNLVGSISLSTRNSYGKEIIYCALSESTMLPAETATYELPYYIDGTDSIVSYSALTKQFENGIHYVLKHRDFDFKDSSLDGKALSILISPYSSEKISCKDVEIDSNGNPRIFDSEGLPAGLVKMVTKDEKYSSSINKPVNINSIDYTNSTTFNSLVGSYETMQPSRFILDLHDKGSDYDVTGNLTISSKFPGTKDQFIINGQGSNSAINAALPYVVTFENMSVKLNNVLLSSNVTLKLINSTLDISDASSVFSHIILKNSKILGTSSITINGNLSADNSELAFNESLLINGDIVLVNSSLNNKSALTINGQLNADSSEIKIDGVTVITESSKSNVFIKNSTIYQTSEVTLNKTPSNNLYSLSLNSSSKYIVSNTILNLSKDSNGNSPTLRSVFVDSTSLMSIENSSTLRNEVRHNFGSIIDSWGKVNINNSIVNSTETVRYFITLKRGSELIINRSSFGDGGDANTTIDDRGAKLISGENSFIYGNRCWNNFSPIFNGVLSNTVGNSVPLMNTNKTFNSSNWLCN